MKIKINFKGRSEELELKEMLGINKMIGLIFYREALLFNIKNQAIHSLFCPRFLAIWFNKGRIVEYKLVEPWKLLIKPEKEFDRLIEIPLNSKYSSIIGIFLKNRDF
jgi:hypothetical protein